MAEPSNPRHFLSKTVILAHVLIFAAALTAPLLALAAALRVLFDHAETGPADVAFAPLTRRWFDSLWNSVAMVAVAAVVALGGGTLLGWLIARARARVLESLLVAAACAPYAALITFILAPLQFWLLYGSVLLCGVAHGIVFLPLAALGLGRAMARADRDLTDAARLDAREWATLRYVLMPSAAWAYVALGAYLALFILTDYSISDLFRVRTFAEEIYLQYALDTSLGRAALTGLPVLMLGTPLLLAALRYLREHGVWSAAAVASVEDRARSGGGLAQPRPPFRTATIVTTALVLVTIVGVVATVAGRLASPADFLTRTWAMRDELLNSAIVALASVAALLAIAVGVGWTLLRGGRARHVIVAGLALILATPAPIIAIALIDLLNRPGLPGLIYDSPAGTAVGLFVRFLPFAILLLVPGIQRIPRPLEESMKLDGASWLETQRHLYWPNLARDLAFCALVLLVATFGEIACTMLLVPPGYTTVAVRAYTLLHFGVYQDLAALALASTGVVLVVVFSARAVLGWFRT